MAVTVKVDTSGLDRALREFGEGSRRRIEIAAQRAVLKTARAVMDAERAEMQRVFDRPTRWTLNAFRVALGKESMWAGKLRTEGGSEISASLQVKDGYWYRADNYLDTQIMGGERRQKAFERALQWRGVLPAGWRGVPGKKAKLDAFGNHSPGEIRQILSWFGSAELVAGSIQNMTDATRAKRRKGTRTQRGFEYVAIQPGNRRGRLLPGIYRRTFFGFGSGIEPVMIFVQRASYKPRFDFYGLGQRVADATFAQAFNDAFDASQ